MNVEELTELGGISDPRQVSRWWLRISLFVHL